MWTHTGTYSICQAEYLCQFWGGGQMWTHTGTYSIVLGGWFEVDAPRRSLPGATYKVSQSKESPIGQG
jgi:hypothetical protein